MISGRRVEYRSYNDPTDDGLPPADITTVQYSSLKDDKNGPLVTPDSTGYSDYSNSALYNVSNYQVFCRDFAQYEGVEWWHYTGGHDTTGVVVRVDAGERVPEIEEFFDALESYPIADEHHESQLEQEFVDTAWGRYGRQEFVRWLRGNAPVATMDEDEWEEAVDELDDARLDEIWWDAVHNGSGEEYVISYPDVSFHFDRTFRGKDVYALVTGKVNWAEVLRDYVLGRVPSAEKIRVRDIDDETMDAWLEYLTSARPASPEGDWIFEPLNDWGATEWSIYLDVLEEEGADAFARGGHGRTRRSLGRR